MKLALKESIFHGQKTSSDCKSTVLAIINIIQSNLYNPTLHGTADLCRITQDVRLSSYLHNPTLGYILRGYYVGLHSETMQ